MTNRPQRPTDRMAKPVAPMIGAGDHPKRHASRPTPVIAIEDAPFKAVDPVTYGPMQAQFVVIDRVGATYPWTAMEVAAPAAVTLSAAGDSMVRQRPRHSFSIGTIAEPVEYRVAIYRRTISSMFHIGRR